VTSPSASSCSPACSAPEEPRGVLGAAEALRGDAAVDFRERPVLERFEPELEAALGDDALATLKREGADLGLELAFREVVRTGT